MAPGINSGDFVLTSSIPQKLGFLKSGMRVVFDTSEYGLLIKKITGFSKDGDKFYFSGTRPSSISSDQTGPVNIQKILGTVLFVIRERKRSVID